jgi:hypothetical protein
VTDARNRRLSADGFFPGGIAAAAVVQFIRDYDEAARIEDVAAYFRLETTDVADALTYVARQSNVQQRRAVEQADAS